VRNEPEALVSRVGYANHYITADAVVLGKLCQSQIENKSKYSAATIKYDANFFAQRFEKADATII